MSNFKVEELADLLEAAMASYGDFPEGEILNSDQLKQLLIDDAGFTETQADEFIKRYNLIHHLPNQASGFSATVFWDKIDQKYVVAFRGTETDIGGVYSDVLNADLLGIGGRGFAVNQAIDLYRYWRQLTTPAGQNVVYSVDELKPLNVPRALDVGPLIAADFVRPDRECFVRDVS